MTRWGQKLLNFPRSWDEIARKANLLLAIRATSSVGTGAAIRKSIFGLAQWKWGKSSSYTEFLPPAASVQESPPSPIRLALAEVICALVVITLIITWFGKVDIYAVAPGRIQPTGRSKVVQPFSAGVVRRLFAREGETVKAGTLLAELDSTEQNADQNAAASRLSSLKAEIIRRKAVLEAVTISPRSWQSDLHFPNDIDEQYRQRETSVAQADLLKIASSIGYLRSKQREAQAQHQALQAMIAAEDKVISTLANRVKMRTDLESAGWESRASVLDATESLDRETGTRTTDLGQLVQNEAALASLSKQIDQTIGDFVADYSDALEKVQNELDGAAQDYVKARSKAGYTRIFSPIDGTVQQLTITTLGQVVGAGEQIMTVVPTHNNLEVEALVSSQDIGFVQPGQEAVIKIDSFPFEKYGTISGRVVHVSRDSLQASQAQSEMDTQRKPTSARDGQASALPPTGSLVFPATIALSKDKIFGDGRWMPLSSGMSGVIEVKTGQRRLLEYILSPFIDLQSRSLHER